MSRLYAIKPLKTGLFDRSPGGRSASFPAPIAPPGLPGIRNFFFLA